jgi:hypothetical protein
VTRLTDEQFTALLRGIPLFYEGGTLDDLPEWAREWVGPDGGTLSLLNELKAERDRAAAVLALHQPPGGYSCTCCRRCVECGKLWPCDTRKALAGKA